MSLLQILESNLSLPLKIFTIISCIITLAFGVVLYLYENKKREYEKLLRTTTRQRTDKFGKSK